MSDSLSRRVPLGHRHRRAPDRGRQLEQRLVGVGARARAHRASSRRATPATTSGATPEDIDAARRARLQGVPLLGRVVAHRARGGRVLARRARPLPPDARRLPRPRPRRPSSRSTTSRRPGGWRPTAGGPNPAIVDRFARFCEHAVDQLGDRIGIGCTINEPNVVSLIGYDDRCLPARPRPRPRRVRHGERHLLDAHRRSYDVLKAGPGDFPVGLTVSMSDWCRRGRRGRPDRRVPPRCTRTTSSRASAATTSSACRRTPAPASVPTGCRRARARRRGAADGLRVLAAARSRRRSGTRPRSRRRRSTSPRTASAPTTTTSASGTCATRSRASPGASTTGSTCAATSTGRCMDNFEWAFGYMPRFGLVAVDRETQARTLKPSAPGSAPSPEPAGST